MAESLYEKLIQYSQSDYYPFHMPGHKRNPKADFLPYQLDITEIDGFDNLHCAKGILKEAQQQAADLYGADESYFLINGSTSGLLAAISTVTSSSGKIIMARNCHKAAYHAAFLKQLETVYIYPELEPDYMIQGGILESILEEQLRRHKDVQAVMITSPTYDGMVSDIKSIARVVHQYGIPLIVDEAHGAHFGFLNGVLPDSSIKNGADIVIHSMHKTLPSMTQTALLHVNGSLVDRRRLKRYLQIFQTSSPSYVMMAGMQKCVELLAQNAEQLFEHFIAMLAEFMKSMQALKHLHIFSYQDKMKKYGIYHYDICKILIFTDHTNMTGKQLYDILLHTYHLQMEMAASNYVIAMTSIMDTRDGFKRLEKALLEIDEQLQESNTVLVEKENLIIEYPEVCMKISTAQEAKSIRVLLAQSAGFITAEYVYLYPPGIPILAPGEKIKDSIIKQVGYYKSAGLDILGLDDESAEYILVVAE